MSEFFFAVQEWVAIEMDMAIITLKRVKEFMKVQVKSMIEPCGLTAHKCELLLTFKGNLL